MRVLAILVLGVLMYFAVPLLWQRAMMAKVNEISANSADIPVGKPVEINYEASENLINAMQPQINEEEVNRMAQIGAQAAAEDSMRQAQAAQDRAWAATHGETP